MTNETETGLLFRFDNSYARLPAMFYARVAPTPVKAPRLIRANAALARDLELESKRLDTPEAIAVLAGNQLAQGSDPIAMAYAGHQFGGFVPQLGDGRAILLGEVLDLSGQRRDIQLKGSGPTPFSRRGDGRAALGPVLREYLVAEAMHALGIPTTRALAAVTTGEPVWRDQELPGAILTRVASSHIRVGTFQFFAARDDVDALRHLADHVIARHYPEAAEATNPYRALLDVVIARQAELVAQWLCVGFIHGVMNTDNMAISGETIDYGPCAFMDFYNPAQVYSSIDSRGRYAFAKQPPIAQWNLARFAETLVPLLAGETSAALGEAQKAIDAFRGRFEAAWEKGLNRKLGLVEQKPGDLDLAQDLLGRMAAGGADFTLTFRRLCNAQSNPESNAEISTDQQASGLAPNREPPVRELFSDPAAFDAWAARWWQRLSTDPQDAASRAHSMRQANPAVIPRNHLVEEVISAAVADGDFTPFESLVEVLSAPYDDHPVGSRYTLPPEPDEIVQQTFCGT
ncbi:MAG: YdiU family protein [Hyphomicrobium sp.]|jgi:uncharacterized protein YdiU (UPF0061 family)